MTDVTASRTLVKSPPELWTECSQAETLGRHLDSFGEIRITRLEPETTVAWEGERVSGTVRLEPSGWGTRVVMTATATPHPAAVGPREPRVAPDVGGASRADRPLEAGRGLGTWLRRLLGRPAGAPGAAAHGPAAPRPEPATAAAQAAQAAAQLDPEAVLGAALESLGKAHHRPFSRH